MQRTLILRLSTFLLTALLSSGGLRPLRAAPVLRAESVTLYTTYGYQEGQQWVIPMRVWIHERRDTAEKWITRLVRKIGTREPYEIRNFRFRLEDFVADSQSGEVVRVQFDQDPAQQEYRLQNHQGTFPKTDANGLIRGVLRLSQSTARTLLQQQGSSQGWLTVRASSRDYTGVGRVRLLEPTGLSVISDIDDTVKITDIPAGPQVVVNNTFFRDFVAAPGMAAMYQEWPGAAFHYVSGGPWQLYRPLSAFLFSAEGGFPAGSFHMKNVRKNLLNIGTWRDLTALLNTEENTFLQKTAAIRAIMQKFPQRTFILVGDSGEKDPEVYRQIKQEFPTQVQEIRIRDVVNDRQHKSRRFDGMTIIPAPTVRQHVEP